MEHLLSERARLTTSSAIRDLLRLTAAPHVLSMAGGLPAAELFPVDELRAITAQVLDDPGTARDALQYGPTEGSDELRAVLASRARATGVHDGRDVLVTTGSQQGLDLLARVLVDREDVVVVESPTYLGALQALRGSVPNLVAVPGDHAGIDTAHLEALLRRGMRPKLCYVVANFSNPAGATLSLERRVHLAALADRYGFVVVEDDPYGALRHRGRALPPVASFGEHVVTLGSTSKTLAPGLRVGWVQAPAAIHAALVRAKQATDLHTSSLSQVIAARALVAPWFDAHVARSCDAYAARSAALLDALAAHGTVFAPVARPEGGLFAWAELRAPVDTTVLLTEALAGGVAYVPGAAFDPGSGHRSHVRLSFATLPPERLGEAVDRLARVAERAARSTRHAALT